MALAHDHYNDHCTNMQTSIMSFGHMNSIHEHDHGHDTHTTTRRSGGKSDTGSGNSTITIVISHLAILAQVPFWLSSRG